MPTLSFDPVGTDVGERYRGRPFVTIFQSLRTLLYRLSSYAIMSWFPKALIVLASLTTALAGKRYYYPAGCEKSGYSTTDFCVLICDGKDACEGSLRVPPSSIKHFIVRCVGGNPSCNSLKEFKNKGSVKIYLLCIKRCNSAEEASSSARYVYCGDCNNAKSRRVNALTNKNGVQVVIFDNGIALARQERPNGQSNLGIISNGPFHIFPVVLSARCR